MVKPKLPLQQMKLLQLICILSTMTAVVQAAYQFKTDAECGTCLG